jgi:hypothetical protein
MLRISVVAFNAWYVNLPDITVQLHVRSFSANKLQHKLYDKKIDLCLIDRCVKLHYQRFSDFNSITP